VLFGAAALIIPQADAGMVSAVPRLTLGTPEHPFCFLLLPTVGYGAPHLHHRVFTYHRSVAVLRPLRSTIILICAFAKRSRKGVRKKKSLGKADSRGFCVGAETAPLPAVWYGRGHRALFEHPQGSMGDFP
jgi:hypothetical protein